MFGKGQRQDLDEEDATSLGRQIRQALKQELEILGSREGGAALHVLFDGGVRNTPKL